MAPSEIGMAFRESFGFKILSSFIAVIVVTLTVYTAISALREGNRIKEKLRSDGELFAGLLARTSVVGIFSENRKLLADSAAGVLEQKDVLSVSMYSPEMRLLYAGRKYNAAEDRVDLGTQNRSDKFRIIDSPEVFEFIQPVRSGGGAAEDETIYFGPATTVAKGRLIGYVRIVLTKRAYRREIQGLVARNILMMAVFIAASVIIVSLAVNRILRPLANLTATARALETGLSVPRLNIRSRDEIGNLATAFNAMIEARGRAEESLRESEERYRRLVELSPDAIIVLGGGLFLFLNAAAVKLLGGSGPADLLGTEAADLLPKEDRFQVTERFLRVEREGIPIAFLPLRYLREDGTVAEAEAAVAPFPTESGRAVLVIARDVTERNALEDRVRSYERELREATERMSSLELRVEERERHLIATDLHDYVGQNLVASQFKLGMLKRTLSSSDGLQQIEEVGELLAQTIQYTRSLTVELSSPVLVEIGLTAAVRSLAEDFENIHGITIRVEDDGEPKPVPNEARYLLYRSVRELLLNVVKHAGTTAATVEMYVKQGVLFIIVRDNGSGFEPSTIISRAVRGFGLFAIKERISSLGGICEIESRPGSGSMVTLQTPLVKSMPVGKGTV